MAAKERQKSVSFSVPTAIFASILLLAIGYFAGQQLEAVDCNQQFSDARTEIHQGIQQLYLFSNNQSIAYSGASSVYFFQQSEPIGIKNLKGPLQIEDWQIKISCAGQVCSGSGPINVTKGGEYGDEIWVKRSTNAFYGVCFDHTQNQFQVVIGDDNSVGIASVDSALTSLCRQ